MSYIIWSAAIAAGATLDQLEKLEQGGYSRAFLAKVVAWYNISRLIDLHANDAQNEAIKKATKNKR
jgi:hypothetical protein